MSKKAKAIDYAPNGVGKNLQVSADQYGKDAQLSSAKRAYLEAREEFESETARLKKNVEAAYKAWRALVNQNATG